MIGIWNIYWGYEGLWVIFVDSVWRSWRCFGRQSDQILKIVEDTKVFGWFSILCKGPFGKVGKEILSQLTNRGKVGVVVSTLLSTTV